MRLLGKLFNCKQKKMCRRERERGRESRQRKKPSVNSQVEQWFSAVHVVYKWYALYQWFCIFFPVMLILMLAHKHCSLAHYSACRPYRRRKKLCTQKCFSFLFLHLLFCSVFLALFISAFPIFLPQTATALTAIHLVVVNLHNNTRFHIVWSFCVIELAVCSISSFDFIISTNQQNIAQNVQSFPGKCLMQLCNSRNFTTKIFFFIFSFSEFY